MDYTTSSGTLSLKKVGNYYDIYEVFGCLSNTLLSIRFDYFSDLQFLAKCLDYDESNLSKGSNLKTNNVFITHTVKDNYSIGKGDADLVELSKEKMSDLMKCLMVSEEWKVDKLVLKYGFTVDNRPWVNTIRDGKHYPGYSPSIIKGHFSLSIEDDGQIVIYYLTKWGNWVDVFSLNNGEMIKHLRQALLMIKDSMISELPIWITYPYETFKYQPQYSSSVEVVINGRQKILNKDDISDLICVIGMI